MRFLLPVVVLALGVLAWDLIVRVREIPPYVLPGPGLVFETLVADWTLLSDSLLVTLMTTLQGFVLAVVGGVGLAVLFNQSRLIEYSFYPYAVILQVTPIVAIAPLLLVWLPQEAAVLACAWIVAFFPVLANTTLGLNSVDHNLADLFRLYGASRLQVLRRLKLPAALPYILGGLKIAGGLSLIGAVVAEMAASSAGAGSGLAYRIAESGYRLNIPRMFAALVLLSVAGIVIYFALALVLPPDAAALARKRGGARRLTHVPSVSRTAIPSAAMIATTSIRPRWKRNASNAAMAASAAVLRSSASGSKANQRTGPNHSSRTWPNSTCSANQTDRLRMTPTTAAVMAASAPDSRRLERSCSTNGAPAKIHSIDGTKVTQVVSAAPRMPPASGENGRGSR